MAKRHIVIVPGLWEGPTVFQDLSDRLEKAGFDTSISSLASTGTVSPGNPSMKDDVAQIRKTLLPLVEAGKDVVLVLHSAGGFLGSEAMENLDKQTRMSAGQSGGVVKIVFMAAGIAPKGYLHQPLPFAETKGGAMYCTNIKQAFFHDTPEADVEKWMSVMRPQPAEGWRETTTYCGWEVVPSVYLIAVQDAVVPLALQQQLAAMAKSEVVEVDAGHMLMLSKPEEVVGLVAQHATT